MLKKKAHCYTKWLSYCMCVWFKKNHKQTDNNNNKLYGKSKAYYLKKSYLAFT